MAKQIGEDTKVTFDLKTIGLGVAGLASISTLFPLQSLNSSIQSTLFAELKLALNSTTHTPESGIVIPRDVIANKHM